MTKYRLIERYDGRFQYEYQDSYGEWQRINYMYFSTEEEARKRFFDIMFFINASETKNIICELGELCHSPF